MKRCLIVLSLMLAMQVVRAQLPQFSSQSFAGWTYTNPATPLNATNILKNAIILYTTSTGLQQTLVSPQFACYGGQTINMDVTWITDQWQDDGFDVSKVVLTAALLDAEGLAVDSVTVGPDPARVSRTNHLHLAITVPAGMTRAVLRFASWRADVNNCGAVRQIDMVSTLKGDVNLDGEVSVADINAIIQVVSGASVADDLRSRADVNGDNEVTVADINSVIELILQ